MDSTAEASQLVKAIGAGAESKKERRLKAWRKVAKHFSWNRIVDLDRAAKHARVSGDELRILRAAARQGEEANEQYKQYREVADRLAALEARLAAIDAKLGFEGPGEVREADDGLGGGDKPLAET